MNAKAWASAIVALVAFASANLAAANEWPVEVTADHVAVPGATLFVPSNPHSKRKLPVLVTGLLGNCSLEATPEIAASAAQHFHIPVAQRGFAVLAVGKINSTAPSPYAVTAGAPRVNGALDPNHLPPEVKQLLDNGWLPWRDALNALEASVASKQNPYYGKFDFQRIGAWGVSCGGVNSFTLAANDSRIKSVLGWSSATSPINTEESSRAMLARIAPRPAMWAAGGPADIARAPAMRDWANIPSSMPALIALHKNRDHAGMSNAETRWIADWFDFALYPGRSAHSNLFRNPASLCQPAEPCDWTVQTANWNWRK